MSDKPRMIKIIIRCETYDTFEVTEDEWLSMDNEERKQEYADLIPPNCEHVEFEEEYPEEEEDD